MGWMVEMGVGFARTVFCRKCGMRCDVVRGSFWWGLAEHSDIVRVWPQVEPLGLSEAARTMERCGPQIGQGTICC